MKANLSDIAYMMLVIVGIILYSPIYGSMKVWLLISRRILMPHFNIETRIYRKWHDHRAARIQRALDRQHNKNIITSLT